MFVCEKCGKTFTHNASLSRHKKIHGQRDYFFCQQCPSSFTRREHLNRHVRTIHGRNDQPGPSTSRDRSRSPLRRSPSPPSSRPEPPRTEQNDHPVDLPEDPETRDIYLRHWQSIRTQENTGNPVQDRYNFILHNLNVGQLEDMARHIFGEQRTAFTINVSFGFILRHIETGELRYYHPSFNNNRYLDVPHRIQNEEDLNRFIEELGRHDILEHIRQQRPDTKWVVHLLTNITFYVNKIVNHPIGAHVFLPDYVSKNSGINALVAGSHGPHNDNLCFFRCYALHRGAPVLNPETSAKTYFREYIRHRGITSAEFKGVTLDELPLLEHFFEINVTVYELKEDEETGNVNALLVRRSPKNFTDVMNLNLFDRHFSYINDMRKFSSSYACTKCGKLWKSHKLVMRHEKTCQENVRYNHPGGVYQPTKSVFEELEDEDITVPEDCKYYPYRATYDIETMLEATDRANSDKLSWINQHTLLSVSVASNIPDYEEPKCFVSTGNTNEVVQSCIEYLEEMSFAAYHTIYSKYFNVFQQINAKIDKDLQSITEPEEREHVKKSHYLNQLKQKLERHLLELPVIGFNSGKYDLNAVKIEFFTHLTRQNKVKYAIKRNNNFMCVKTEKLKFLDITNYLAPGFSYAQFLKAYGCSEEKGYFPYEWMTSLDKLDNTELPPHSAFHSSLKNANITKEEYQYCQELWNRNNMSTMKDFLVFYNNKDVQPMIEVLEKMFQFNKDRHIDMFKDGISVPGLTLKYMFQGLKDVFTLPTEHHKDIYRLFKDNIVGGPSIVFHRYHERDVTFIRPTEYQDPKLCRTILGFDANALYLYCVTRPLPCGFFILRKEETNFKRELPRRYHRKAIQWLEWEASQSNVYIQHQGNSSEKLIGIKRLPVDGFCKETNTVYEFQGCIWHGHQCWMTKKYNNINPVNRKPFNELRQGTLEKINYIKDQGYTVVEIWECQWHNKVKYDPALQLFIDNMKRPCDEYATMSQQQIMEAVMDDKLFGALEVDIHVPTHLKSKFSEMPPIFKNTEISRDDIGDHMRQYAIDHDIMTQPRKSLIGSMFGEKIMLITPLLKWYINHGLVVTKIYQVVEYTPSPCFQHFGNVISDARRAGDADPDKKILAETHKLDGNSSYGKTVTNKEKHTDIVYCNDKTVNKYLVDPFFRRCNQLNDDTYEIEMSKKVINLDLPIQIGCFVYQYAKLRMLEFYFDFMDVFVDRKDFQYCSMDTDSAYMALSANTLEEVIKPELYQRYQAEKHLWFPRDDTPEHAAYDKRTPGLFKVEYEGDGIIALCSKTYFCFGKEDKYSCKGINKKLNTITKDTYMDVLLTKKSGSGTNRGFRSMDNKIYTYLQERAGFSYFYPKRKVLQDGVSTAPLDL